MTKSLPQKSLVLYADDDADDVSLLQEAFNDYSHLIEFITFSSGTDLLAYIDGIAPLQPSPCLVILDINMPQLNGQETLRRLRSRHHTKEVPVVLFSTSTLPADAAFAGTYNAGFVTKPLNIHQINQIVDQLLDHCTDEVRRRLKRR